MSRTGHAPRVGGLVRSYGPWVVAAAFSVSGVIHLVHPATFTSIVPHFLPFATALVYVSGIAELICAYGLWRRRRWAGLAATALLLAVWPANLQAAITAQQGDNVRDQLISWIRFPLQIPLIWLALQSGRLRLSVDQRDQRPLTATAHLDSK